MADDLVMLTERLGRAPEGDFEVVVRGADGSPVVIRNAPFLRDGTPMPTRYWLVDPAVRAAVSRLEVGGGVRAAEAEVAAAALAAAHAAYAAERDAAIDPDHAGPRPSGGVGGTRRGREVPPRPLRLVPRRRRRPRSGAGSGSSLSRRGAT